jgi:hypothetical protein
MLTLKRAIKVEAYVALAEIGMPSKSHEILAILQLAQEQGGTLRAKDVNIKLLDHPEESPHAQRILMVIESFGLLEKMRYEEDAYRLTAAGTDNLQNGQIMIPEQGAYILFITEDSLLREAIIRVERDIAVEQTESSAYFRNNKRMQREQVAENLQKPSYLNKYVHGYLFRQVANSNAPIQINSISDRVARSARRLSASVSLELEPGSEPVLRVKSTVGNSSSVEICTETRFNKTYNEVIEALTANIGSLLILDGEPILLVAWASLNPNEAESFRKQITVEAPQLWEFGTFESTSINLRILPATIEDATAWANFLLKQSITTYTDKLEYEHKIQKVTAKFNQKYNPDTLAATMTTFDDLVKQVIEERKKGSLSPLYWRLVAPQDLNSR